MNLSIVTIAQPGQTEYYGHRIVDTPRQLDHGPVLQAGYHTDIETTYNFYRHTDDWIDIDNSGASLKERLQYRADRRNTAVKILLVKYPETTDIIMVDSFYLDEAQVISALIERYKQLPIRAVLGPATWAKLRTNVSQVLRSSMRFYDAWSTPELRWCPYGWKPDNDILTGQEDRPLKGLYRVSSVGGCYIFPRKILDEGGRYSVPFDCHGCEHNGFHASHRLPIYIDFTNNLFRTKKYSLAKCLRVSIGNRMRIL